MKKQLLHESAPHFAQLLAVKRLAAKEMKERKNFSKLEFIHQSNNTYTIMGQSIILQASSAPKGCKKILDQIQPIISNWFVRRV
jgi:hypothetical protein